MQINKYHGSYNISKRTQDVRYIVVHYTGSGTSKAGSAKNNCIYFSEGDRGASAHYFIDDGGIWEYAGPDEYYTWHCGDGHGKYGITNANSIGIEVCLDGDNPYTAKEIGYLGELVRYLMNKYGIPANRVVRHYDASRKLCPYYYAKREGEWSRLRTRITTSTPDGWQTIGGKRYYYKNGKPVKWTQYIGGKRYYFNGAGVMQTGWITWKDDGSKSYFDKNGVCCQNWQKIGGKWYYFDPKTYKAVKWSQTIDGKRYYFNGQGIMHTGWLQWNKSKTWSYFKPDGTMASLTLAKDGSVIAK